MRYILILLCCLVMNLLHQAGAQELANRQQMRDTLEAALNAAQTDSAKAMTMTRLARYWSATDSTRALYYSRTAYALFSRINNHFGMALSKFEEGTALLNQRLFNPALDELNAGKVLLEKDTAQKSLLLLGNIWFQVSTVNQRRGNDKDAMDIMLKKALPYYEAAKNEEKVAFVYGALGNYFKNIEQYDKAVYYYKKELLEHHWTSRYEPVAVDYASLAICLTELKRFDEAGSFLHTAAEMLKNDSQSYAWLKYYYAEGYCYQQQGFKELALDSYNKGIAKAQQNEDKYSSLDLYFGQYTILKEQKKYAAARAAMYTIMNISREINDTQAANWLVTYNALYEIEKLAGNNTAALQWLEKYSSLADSVHKDEEKVKLTAMEQRFQAERKEKEILQLQNTAKQQQLALNRDRFTMVLLVGGLSLAALLLAVFYISAKNRKRIAQQRDVLHQQQLKELEKEKKLLLYNAMLEGQERERARLSGDLHDGLGGMLSGINLRLRSIADNKRSVVTELEPVIQQLGSSVKELRRIAHNLMPENLLRFGLEEALKDLCEALQTPQTSISFYAARLDTGIPMQEQLTIYRIVQELVANACKHAHATEVLVQCFQEKSRINITVEDNGRGFDTSQLTKKTGMGLFNVQSRIQYLKGNMDVQSQAGVGTTVVVDLNVNSYD